MSTSVAVVATLAVGALGAVVRGLAVGRAPRAGTAAVNLVGTIVLALTIVASPFTNSGVALAEQFHAVRQNSVIT